MTDLTEFLKARLDEDEQAAKRVRQPYRLYVCDDGHVQEPMRVDDLYGERDGEYQQWSDGEDRLPNHRNTWWLMYDPARVLRDVESKRLLLAEHTPEQGIPYEGGDENDPSTWIPCCSRCQVGVVLEGDWPCLHLRLLALPYADHPDYREEWRPT